MTNTTRVTAFKTSRDVCQRVYPESGVKTPFPFLFPSWRSAFADRGVCQANRYHVGMMRIS